MQDTIKFTDTIIEKDNGKTKPIHIKLVLKGGGKNDEPEKREKRQAGIQTDRSKDQKN